MWAGRGLRGDGRWIGGAKHRYKTTIPTLLAPAPPLTSPLYNRLALTADDHIEPVVGVRTATSSDAYDPADTFYVHANYATAAIQRVASGFWCTAAAKTSGLMQGGCVPAATTHGYAVRGPAYSGIGPAVELAVSSAREPGLGLSVAMSGTITIKNLVPGQAYELHMVTSLAAVPASANPAALSGTPLSSFVADGATRTFSATFQSGTPAYFICVAA